MSTVLDKLLTCREKNTITGKMISVNPVGRKLIKRRMVNHVNNNKTNIRKKNAESNISKADLTTHLELLKKWIDPSSKTDLLEGKDDMRDNTKNSDEMYSKEHTKRSFDSELLTFTKRLKAISKDSLIVQPYAMMNPSRNRTKISEKNLKFTERLDESASEEENYEYIESDSSPDKFCSLSENITQESHAEEEVEIKENDNSKAKINIRKDEQSVIENSTDNVFQTNKCISVEHIALNTEIAKNSSNHKIDQNVLKLSHNGKTQTVTEYSLINPSVKENFSEIRSTTIKKNISKDTMLKIHENTDPLKSKNHRMNTSNEKLCNDQATEKRPAFSGIRKKSPHVKKLSCPPKVKINPIRNNVPKSCKTKPAQVKILKKVDLQESNQSKNECRSLSAPQNKLSRNKNSKNTETKLSHTKTLNSTRASNVHTSRNKDKSIHKENKKEISSNLRTVETNKFRETHNENNALSNYRKCAPSVKISSNAKNVLKNGCQKLSQKCQFPKSENINDVQRAQFSSSQKTNKTIFSDREIKSPKLNKVVRNECSTKTENNLQIPKRPTVKKGIYTQQQVIKASKNINNKGIPIGEQSLHASESITDTYKSKAFPSKCRENMKTSEEVSSIIILSKDIEKAKMQQNESSILPSISTENAKLEEKKNYIISPENIGNTKTVEEESSFASSKNIENAKTLEISIIIPSKNTENAKTLIEENYPLSKNTKVNQSSRISLSKNAEKVERLRQEHFPIFPPGSTGDLKTPEKECSLVTPLTHTESWLRVKLEEESSPPIEDVNCNLSKPKKISMKEKRRTFTNLPVRQVRKALFRSSENKNKLSKTTYLKSGENKILKKTECNTRTISDERNKRVGKNVDIACSSKSQTRSVDPVKVTDNTHKNNGQNPKISEIGKGVPIKKKKYLKEPKIETE